MKNDVIKIINASENNLKSVCLELPKNKLITFTGPSGSGKSSLAIDTLYVEGQRRYIESLSNYAKQYLGQFPRPEFESIIGLSPTISISSSGRSPSSRSNVGTITEIYDYFRILFSRCGDLVCPIGKDIVKKYSPNSVAKIALALPEKTKLHILGPISFSNIDELSFQIQKFLTLGFSRFEINQEILQLDYENLSLPESITSCSVVIDRVMIKEGIKKRLIESIERAYKESNGKVILHYEKTFELFSSFAMSRNSGESYPDLTPNYFSFNSPHGACPRCRGLGEKETIQSDSIIFDASLSIKDGCFKEVFENFPALAKVTNEVCNIESISTRIPLSELTKDELELIFDGKNKNYKFNYKLKNSAINFDQEFPGLCGLLTEYHKNAKTKKEKIFLDQFVELTNCEECDGSRLSILPRSTYIGEHNISSLVSLPLSSLLEEVSKLPLEGERKVIAEPILHEINSRVSFLLDTGLSYISLDRRTNSLSGGELQRIKISSQLGSTLSGVLYVLDEPSIGLHPRDNDLLINSLKKMRDLGNTVLVVEHDSDILMSSDLIVDIGPGSGVHGGNILFSSSPENISSFDTETALFLSKKKNIKSDYLHGENKHFLTLTKVHENNLKSFDFKFPLNSLVGVCGVSGSGKSTLLNDVLIPAVKSQLRHAPSIRNTNYNSISGHQSFKSVIVIDQKSFSRSGSSSLATYTGMLTEIRKIFSQTPDSKVRGYSATRFSFNAKGGRCDECEGKGYKLINMQFLPDVRIECEECLGKKFNSETLSILYRSKNIADVLAMSVEEALEFFKHHTKINKTLSVLVDLGLGYLTLDQSATTISSGEAQRIKLATELSKRTQGQALYVLDEPTTGLHFGEIELLLKSLNSLVKLGHSVIVIEHNVDLLSNCSHLIELGPSGGEKGGYLIAEGSPGDLKQNPDSITGKFLHD